MRRRLIILFSVLAVASGALAAAPPAPAPSSPDAVARSSWGMQLARSSWGIAAASAHNDVGAAEDVVKDSYRSHCGNGGSWWCDQYPTRLYSEPVGRHSVDVELSWLEGNVSLRHGFRIRQCYVTVRVFHRAITSTLRREACEWR